MCDIVNQLSELPEGHSRAYVLDLINESHLGAVTIKISEGAKKGDNFLGEIYRIVVKGENNKRLHLILKIISRNEAFRDFFPLRQLYERETKIYSDILPVFETFQKSHNLRNIFRNYPQIRKWSMHDHDEFIIMDDLKPLGFVLNDRKTTLDFNHCGLVMNKLGQYHAVSFALRQLQPEVFKRIKNKYKNVFVRYGNHDVLQKQYENMADKARESLDPVKDAHILSVFAKFQTRVFKTMLEISRDDIYEDYGVILHGDCWGNNLLFKYTDPTDSSKPTDIRFLDWQLSCYASPALDLSYFFYHCTNSTILDRHFDELVHIYYTSLSESLKGMGCNAEKLFPLRSLEDQMKKYFAHGLYMACSSVFYITSDADQLPDTDEMTHANYEQLEKWEYESRNLDLYHERISGVIRHAVRRGFI